MKEKRQRPKIIIENFILCSIIFTASTLIVWFCHAEIKWSTGNSIDYNAFGEFGGFIGGVLGTSAAIVGAYFVYITYKGQFDTFQKQQIENHFFELLKLHEVNVTTLKGIDPKIFYGYIRNINIFKEAITEYLRSNNVEYDNQDILIASYLYFFFGVDQAICAIIKKNTQINEEQIDKLHNHIGNKGLRYDGAYNDLGIYFRQLYQVVTYIDKQTVLSYSEKYDYVKALRVRLNIEEQYLLFLNSLCEIGKKWELEAKNQAKNSEISSTEKDSLENKYLITKYNLIKNIPFHYTPIENIAPDELYPDVQYEVNRIITDGRKRLLKIFNKLSPGV